MKLGIVTLQRKPPDVMNWVRYHREIGITNFYMWLEDSDELKPKLERQSGMYIEIGKVDRKKEDNYTDLMTRQQNFVNRMIGKAKKDGVDWIFHIDDDELLYPQKPGETWAHVMKRVNPSCASVHMQNWEGFSPHTPTGSWIQDSSVKYMTTPCQHLYAAYTNGKSGTRTVDGQAFMGPHHFQGGAECELPEAEGVVLHHDSLATSPYDMPPAAWIEKNKLRAHSDMSKIPFEAAKASVHSVLHDSILGQQQVWEHYRSQIGERFQACPAVQSVNLPSYKW
jgi:hypothetical protein